MQEHFPAGTLRQTRLISAAVKIGFRGFFSDFHPPSPFLAHGRKSIEQCRGRATNQGFEALKLEIVSYQNVSL